MNKCLTNRNKMLIGYKLQLRLLVTAPKNTIQMPDLQVLTTQTTVLRNSHQQTSGKVKLTVANFTLKKTGTSRIFCIPPCHHKDNLL